MNVKSQPLIGAQTASVGLANAIQPKAVPGVLVSLLGYNSGPDQFIQIHDAASEPAEGATPLFAFKVLASQNFSLDVPVLCNAGIYVCNSTTLDTKTLGAADTLFVTRNY